MTPFVHLKHVNLPLFSQLNTCVFLDNARHVNQFLIVLNQDFLEYA
jgi:hypothetical protein